MTPPRSEGFATPWAKAALRYGANAPMIVLFLLSIRRSGERVGRIAERLEIKEKTNAVQRRMLEAAARRPRDCDGCATGGFDGGGPVACPPFVEYSGELQARAAEELALLPEGSAMAEMMADYAVVREQARSCEAS
jgi:hypothetical protein